METFSLKNETSGTVKFLKPNVSIWSQFEEYLCTFSMHENSLRSELYCLILKAMVLIAAINSYLSIYFESFMIHEILLYKIILRSTFDILSFLFVFLKMEYKSLTSKKLEPTLTSKAIIYFQMWKFDRILLYWILEFIPSKSFKPASTHRIACKYILCYEPNGLSNSLEKKKCCTPFLCKISL